MVVVNAPVASAVTVTDESGVPSTEYVDEDIAREEAESLDEDFLADGRPRSRIPPSTVACSEQGITPGRHRCGEQHEQGARGDE